MNTVMSENLEDLRDIRRQMDIYQPLGQEYLRQMSFYRNYEKAVERWAPENKLKHAGICILSMLITGPIGLGAAVLLFLGGHEKIEESKKKQLEKQTEKVTELSRQFQESYGPVREKCERLLLGQEDYEVPMAVDYLIYVIESGRAETMKEAYNMLDEQLHRWMMEKLQRDQLELQKKQCKQLRNIEINTAAGAAFDLFNLIK